MTSHRGKEKGKKAKSVMSNLRPGLCPLLTETVNNGLRKSGVKTITEFAVQDLEDLSQRSGVPYKELLAVRRVLLAQYSAIAVTGTQLYQDAMSSVSILTTGCSSVDELLDGGLYTGEVTEIAGETAVGKTQFCMSCTVSVICSSNQNVLYFDTCGAFCGERMLQIAEQSGHDIEETTFQKVRCCQVFDVFSLLTELEEIKGHLKEQTDGFYGNLKLVIVDNVASVIYPVLGGQQMDGHSLMVTLSQKLKQLAHDFSLALLITNNVVGQEERYAGLGKTWSHVPHTRLIMTPTREELSPLRNITLVKSTKMTTGISARCRIGEQGIQNVTATQCGDHG